MQQKRKKKDKTRQELTKRQLTTKNSQSSDDSVGNIDYLQCPCLHLPQLPIIVPVHSVIVYPTFNGVHFPVLHYVELF